MRFILEEERQAQIQTFMCDVTVVRGMREEKPAVHELSETSLKVLIKAALEPGIWLTAIYGSLGMHPAEGKDAVDDLLARGMVKAHHQQRPYLCA